MRITDPNSVPPSTLPANSTSAAGGVRNEGKPETALRSAGSSGDEVSLSGSTRVLQTGAAQHRNKIAALKAQVQFGQYEVSSAAFAKSLVTETLARSAAS